MHRPYYSVPLHFELAYWVLLNNNYNRFGVYFYKENNIQSLASAVCLSLLDIFKMFDLNNPCVSIVIYYLVLSDHGLYVVYIWKLSSANAPGAWVALPLMNSLQKRCCCFLMHAMLPEGFPISQLYLLMKKWARAPRACGKMWVFDIVCIVKNAQCLVYILSFVYILYCVPPPPLRTAYWVLSNTAPSEILTAYRKRGSVSPTFLWPLL